MRRLLACTGVGVALSFVAGVADAQEYRRPGCDISRGHFLVSQAETTSRADRRRAIRQGASSSSSTHCVRSRRRWTVAKWKTLLFGTFWHGRISS